MIECTAKVWLKKDGIELLDAPFILQGRSCASSGSWQTLAEGTTNSQTEPGTGKVKFTYIDDFDHCIYRIIAPHQVDGLPEVIHEVQTFTLQALVSTADDTRGILNSGKPLV